MEFGFPISAKERPIFSSTRKGALGAKFGISCFGRRNEFLSRKIDRKSVGRGRQIFVKIRCDRSQIIHPRYNSNCAAEWASGPKSLAKLARPLMLAASGWDDRVGATVGARGHSNASESWGVLRSGRREERLGLASPLPGYQKRTEGA